MYCGAFLIAELTKRIQLAKLQQNLKYLHISLDPPKQERKTVLLEFFEGTEYPILKAEKKN
jgi:hypothetical protein